MGKYPYNGWCRKHDMIVDYQAQSYEGLILTIGAIREENSTLFPGTGELNCFTN